jgi:hypothetical protein
MKILLQFMLGYQVSTRIGVDYNRTGVVFCIPSFNASDSVVSNEFVGYL